MGNITNYIIGGGIALLVLILLGIVAKQKAKKRENAKHED